jgi:hypothetical protein
MKQDYLREQILNQGYDQYAFANFMNEKKPGQGLEVRLYTWDELYQYVEEFKNISAYN